MQNLKLFRYLNVKVHKVHYTHLDCKVEVLIERLDNGILVEQIILSVEDDGPGQETKL